MSLISLVYVSYAACPMGQPELLALLAEARRKNEANQITGMLLYRDGYFIQAVEGEPETIKTLYEKLQRDPRHRNLLIIDRNIIQERAFSDWSMGFKNLDTLDAMLYPGLTDFLTQPVSPTHFVDNPSHAQKLLQVFKDQVYY